MWEPWPLATVWAYTACNRDIFTLPLPGYSVQSVNRIWRLRNMSHISVWWMIFCLRSRMTFTRHCRLYRKIVMQYSGTADWETVTRYSNSIIPGITAKLLSYYTHETVANVTSRKSLNVFSMSAFWSFESHLVTNIGFYVGITKHGPVD
jgi:hypothetical protein